MTGTQIKAAVKLLAQIMQEAHAILQRFSQQFSQVLTRPLSLE